MIEDIMRSFRLGIVNFLGVTVPGLIVILLMAFGFLAPITYYIFVACGVEVGSKVLFLSSFNDKSILPFLLTFILLIIAYVIGYIFRLSTPDDLDKISAERVINKMGKENKAKNKAKDIAKAKDKAVKGAVKGTVKGTVNNDNRTIGIAAAKKDNWPYQGEGDNKYPYFHFKKYLDDRKHTNLLPHVKWDEESRSKTYVNIMKLEIYNRSPQLAAIIESNEAHIRLLFGTWYAMKLCIWFVILGLAISIYGLRCEFKFPFMLSSLLGVLIIIGSIFIKNRIQNLFHYRRVRELFDVVSCYHLAITEFDSTGKPKQQTTAQLCQPQSRPA